jgi:methylamine dehydrogenase accessory protein MauD
VSGWWLVSYVVLWALSAATLVVLLVVLRQLGLIYVRLGGGAPRGLEEGPPLGAIIAPFEEAEDETGVALPFPDPEAPLNLLVFASPHCAICKEVLGDVERAASGAGAAAMVVSEGGQEENRRLRALAGRGVRFTTSPSRQRILSVETFPYAIVTDGEGMVLDKATVNGPRDLETLLERASRGERAVTVQEGG